MTANEYQKDCVNMLPKYLTRGDEALMGLMGLNGAAGKLIETYKKTLYEGVVLDEKRFNKTLGDAIHCVAVIAHAVGVELENVMLEDLARDVEGLDE